MKKKIEKIEPNELQFIFIDICSGKAYENLKNSANFENIEKSNNEHKNNLQKIIFKFKDENPMYFLIDEKIIKDEFAFKIVEKDKTYAIYKVDYKEIIYKDYQKNIISRKLKLLKEVFYKNVKDSIWEKKNKIKRTIGGIGGGILSIPFFVGLFIPGVDVLELGIMAPLIGGPLLKEVIQFL